MSADSYYEDYFASAVRSPGSDEGGGDDLGDLDLDLDSSPDSTVPVPGFGFLPRWFYSRLLSYSLAWGIDDRYPRPLDANDTLRRNSAKCEIVSLLFEVSGELFILQQWTNLDLGML